MPNLKLAVLVLLIRFSISQMDVPARQSYVMAVVSQGERSAAAGITGVARTTGAAISPLFVGFMFARHSWIYVPFFLAGTLKVVYGGSKEFMVRMQNYRSARKSFRDGKG
jgi:MFS family permease